MLFIFRVLTLHSKDEREEKLHIAFGVKRSKVNLSVTFWLHFRFERKKERDLAQSYDKSPYIDRKIQKAT